MNLDTIKKRKRRSKEDFINECSIKHNNFYDYSEVLYGKLHDNITIICPIHGNFIQEANHHLRGHGCRKCSTEYLKTKQKDTTESFIEKSKSIHKNCYLYDKTIYGNNAHDKVIITCKVHGDFIIKPNSHLNGGGCGKCGREKCGWTKTSWRNACKNRTAKLYVLKCFNDTEEFLKIGITCRKEIKNKYAGKTMPYRYDILIIIENINSDYIFNLERKIHKQYNFFSYKPNIWFDGFTECYTNNKELLDCINKYSDCH